jgi:serine/threonine protein kinase
MGEEEIAILHVKKLRTEFEIASSLTHKNIVNVVELAATYSGDEMVWCMVMEYCTGYAILVF